MELKSLSFAYPNQKKPILKNIDLKIRHGEFIGIVGRTGSGKTTLFKIIKGLIPYVYAGAFQGKYYLEQTLVTEENVLEVTRNIAFVLQEPEFQVLGSTVERDIAFSLENLGLNRQKIYTTVKEILTAVDLEPLKKRPVTQLSGGELRLVSLAAQLVLKPKILLLDEITTFLDHPNRQRIYNFLLNYRQRNQVTILFATHYIEEIMPFLDRLIVIEAGKILFDGEPFSVLWEVYKTSKNIKHSFIRFPSLFYLAKALKRVSSTFYSQVSYPNVPLRSATHFKKWIITQQQTKPVDNVSIQTQNQVHLSPSEPSFQSSTAAEPIIQVKNLSFWYEKGQPILENITLTVPKGRIIALLGENGSGKTTFLKLLCRLLTPTSGTVLVEQKNTKKTKTSKLAKKITLTFQNATIQFYEKTTFNELLVTLKIHSQKNIPQLHDLAITLLTQFGLVHVKEINPYLISGGEKKKLTLAILEAISPAVYLFDEPSVGQDSRNLELIKNYIFNLKRKGKTIIFATHDLAFALEVADQFWILQNKKILTVNHWSLLFRQFRNSPPLKDKFNLPELIKLYLDLGIRNSERKNAFSYENIAKKIAETVFGSQYKR